MDIKDAEFIGLAKVAAKVFGSMGGRKTTPAQTSARKKNAAKARKIRLMKYRTAKAA